MVHFFYNRCVTVTVKPKCNGASMLYIFRTHPTWRHPTWRIDEPTWHAWNQRGVAQVIQYEIYIYIYLDVN